VTGGVISELAFGGDLLGTAKQLCLAGTNLRQKGRRTEGAREKSRCNVSGGHPYENGKFIQLRGRQINECSAGIVLRTSRATGKNLIAVRNGRR
jgi:hypothetical protein